VEKHRINPQYFKRKKLQSEIFNQLNIKKKILKKKREKNKKKQKKNTLRITIVMHEALGVGDQ
jgi:hypothetical protein